MIQLRYLVALSLLLLPPAVQAHPVPRRCYDRTIAVRLSPEAVLVDYRLEVDPWTVVYVDLPAVADQVDLSRLSKPGEFYEAFTKSYAPILAANLIASLDGQAISFRCTRHGHLEKLGSEVLGHLRCEFTFRADWQPRPGQPRQFKFRDSNYELENGAIRLSLEQAPGMLLLSKTEPDPELKSRPAIDLKPGDDARLREASATFELPAPRPPPQQAPEPSPADSANQTAPEAVALLVVLAGLLAALGARRRQKLTRPTAPDAFR